MSAWLNRCHFGDVRAVLRRMIADGVKVQTIVTSPPYWGLRSYLPKDHADKPLELGSEPTLSEFIDGMVEVFDLCRDILADDGTLWLNMGDSYASVAGGYDPVGSPGLGIKRQAAVQRGDRAALRSGLKPKDLVGQPWRLAFALQDAGWWLRQDIVWAKPNPMPESVTDRCTKSHEYVFLLSRSERYFFDAEAIKERVVGSSKRFSFARETKDTDGEHGQKPQHRAEREDVDYGGMRNKRSVWMVSTEPFSGAHFATFPRKLIEPCILAGAPVGAIVLDPFFGSGTTGQVAQQLGRHFIGIELNEANEPLQRARLAQPALVLEAAA